MKAPVIYKITNVVNGKFYVGSTMDTRERFRTHRNKLRTNKHHCKHLQAAWNKYGEDCFKFAVVEEVASMEVLQAAEDAWLTKWVGNPQCYNAGTRSGAPMRGRSGPESPNYGKPIADDQKAAISATLKTYFAEHPEKHPMRGKKHTPASLAKIAANRVAPAGEYHYRFGKTVSEEVRAKISATQKGKPKAPGRKVSAEGKAKIRANIEAGKSHMHWLGRKHTEESKAKMGVGVVATLPDGTRKEYLTLSTMHQETGVFLPTIIRACRSGRPIQTGPLSGWVLSYANSAPPVIEVPPEYAHLPRTRQLAKEQGAKQYYTGIPCDRGHLSPRATKGTCIACRREDEKKAREAKHAPELSYSHSGGLPPTKVLIRTTAPDANRSEWPKKLAYCGVVDGVHIIDTDVHWIPEDLCTAIKFGLDGDAAQQAYWDAADRAFPYPVVQLLRKFIADVDVA